jgi:hypothetical protein
MQDNDQGAMQPLMALTPLYHFTSDSSDLPVGSTFRIIEYSESSLLRFSPDDILLKHLQIYPPDYLLWQCLPMEAEELRHFAPHMETPDGIEATLQVLFLFPAVNFFRLLRLFKPGRLFAGDTFVVIPDLNLGTDLWETQANQRCSLTSIDYSLLPHKAESFSLTSGEVPFLEIFIRELSPLLDSINSPQPEFPQLEMALQLFGRDDSVDNDVLSALTAFEGLLTRESNAELSYRLSLRVANLLGNDAISRKQIFKDMKEFYELRSKLVHGSGFELKPKQQIRLKQVADLREYLRGTLLSIMALYAEGRSREEVEELLDDIALDGTRRTEVQKITAKFLHM